jgi:hypothetical protein
MDVERTIEFILQMQAKSEARMDKFDKRMEATLKLVQTGMKMLVRIDQKVLALTEAQHKTDQKLLALTEAQRRTDQSIVALTEAQRRTDQSILALTEAQRKTDRKFDRLIDSWTKRRTNGHQSKN